MPALFLLIYRFFRGVRDGLKEPEFRGLFFGVILILLAGTWFYHQVEGWSWLDAFYFSVITLTTVGYGDFSPQTAVGKIFTIVYILLGLGILSTFILLLADHQRRNPSGFFSKISSRGTKSFKNQDSLKEGEEVDNAPN